MNVFAARECSVTVLIATVGMIVGTTARAQTYSTQDRVGRVETNRIVTPVNQLVTPVGIQVDLPGLRPQALALSPDGKLLVTAGKTSELIVVNPTTGAILQHVPL